MDCVGNEITFRTAKTNTYDLQTVQLKSETTYIGTLYSWLVEIEVQVQDACT